VGKKETSRGPNGHASGRRTLKWHLKKGKIRACGGKKMTLGRKGKTKKKEGNWTKGKKGKSCMKFWFSRFKDVTKKAHVNVKSTQSLGSNRGGTAR